MSLSRQQEHKIDSQIIQVYSHLGQLSRMIATLEETVASIDWEPGAEEDDPPVHTGTDAEDRVTPIATEGERAAIAAQLDAWAATMQARWQADGG